jgi:hypothetical protein
MDDRQAQGEVTNFCRKNPGPEKGRNYFVTLGRSGLSSFLVWTAFVLHG